MGLETAGGGGFGDPLERDPGQVLEDALDGLVTLEEAGEQYGVMFTSGATHSVDLAATRLYREELRRNTPRP